MLKRMIAIGLCLSLLAFSTVAMAVEIDEVTTEIGQNYVRYPQLTGLTDEAVQRQINDDLVLRSDVSSHIVTLITLGQNPWTLQVDYEADLIGERIFSAVISAKGKLPKVRDGHAYTALSYDLTTGQRLALADLFTDVEAAVSRMEAIAEASLSEELNGYMAYSQLTPLPRDSFTLDETGITFWYPAEQFSLLSGYAGAVQFWYEELDGLWQESWVEALSAQEQKKRIETSVAEGALPHVDARMGQSIAELEESYRLLRVPDEFPGGRYFLFEDAAFRGVRVISNTLESDVVEGVQLLRGALHGLVIGQSTQADWRNVLGAPGETIDFSQNMAYDYGLPAGMSDVYHFGGNELRLHADETGTLCAIQLCK